MESNHREDSINSSEEGDQAEQDNNDVGTGRSYQCVFCKRGFTTAQALGGHMNIHRKDRARNRPPSINSIKHEENYSGPRFYQPISSHTPPYSAAHEAQIQYRTYFPASTSNVRPLYENNSREENPLRSFPFAEDWRMSLSFQYGQAHAQEMEKKTQSESESESEEDELDLELRLGHDP